MKYGDTVVAATTTLQKRVSLCSTEAEYVPLAEAVKTLVWLRNVLSELGFDQKYTKTFQDNNSCIEWANGGFVKHFKRRKHIDVKYNYAVTMIENGVITLIRTPITDMEDGFLTKALLPGDLSRAISAAKLFA